MPAAVHDKVKFNGKEYAITAISKAPLFDQRAVDFISDLTDGIPDYFYSLLIYNGVLQLDAVYEVDDQDEEFPEIDSAFYEEEQPEKRCFYDGPYTIIEDEDDIDIEQMGYISIGLNINYTGNILIGDGAIRVLQEEMGYQRPYTFLKLIELCFQDGVLVKVIDRSRAARRVRHFIMRDNFQGRDPDLTEEEYVTQCFSLEYQDKAPWLACFPEREEEVLYSYEAFLDVEQPA